MKARLKYWKSFALEFLSIFIAVVSAFALNHWNDNRRDHLAEQKILEEIVSGLEKDLEDVRLNVRGHQMGLRAVAFWRKIIKGEEVGLDSIQEHYTGVLRDFVSIQNTSGYETLKSRGLELIRDDFLRTAIVSLYEYDYKTLKALEESYYEMQFHANYYKEMNSLLAPHFIFNAEGDVVDMNVPLRLKQEDRNVLLSYLNKIEYNRNFILFYYEHIEASIKTLSQQISVHGV